MRGRKKKSSSFHNSSLIHLQLVKSVFFIVVSVRWLPQTAAKETGGGGAALRSPRLAGAAELLLLLVLRVLYTQARARSKRGISVRRRYPRHLLLSLLPSCCCSRRDSCLPLLLRRALVVAPASSVVLVYLLFFFENRGRGERG